MPDSRFAPNSERPPIPRRTKKARKLMQAFAVCLALIVCLAAATLALSQAEIRDHRIESGFVKINLNDSKPVITEDEFLMEPGMTVVKPFFLENESSWAVWFKLYFDEMQGDLANVLEITILDGEVVVLEGIMGQLTEEAVSAAEDLLLLNERKEMKMVIHFPEEAGNSLQNANLSFVLKARAVQTKNNENKDFD